MKKYNYNNLRADIISSNADLSTFSDEEKKIRRQIQKNNAQNTYRKNHPDKIKEIQNNWYKNNGEEYRNINREKLREKDREYKKMKYDKNPEEVRRKARERRLKNPEVYKKISRRAYRNNKEKIIKKGTEYLQKKLNNDPGFKVIHRLRTRVWLALRNIRSDESTLKHLGCTNEELKKHLENQFLSGMNWDNYGKKGWHVDHIRPCASFDLSKESERKKCFHYANLQPLWWKDNLSKGAKL